jgi:hypothetical protein
MKTIIIYIFLFNVSCDLTAQFNFDTIVNRTNDECIKCSNAEFNEYLFEKVNYLKLRIMFVTDSIVEKINKSDSFTKKQKKLAKNQLNKLNKNWDRNLNSNCEIIALNNMDGTQNFYFVGLMKIYILEIQLFTLFDLCGIILEI